MQPYELLGLAGPLRDSFPRGFESSFRMNYLHPKQAERVSAVLPGHSAPTIAPPVIGPAPDMGFGSSSTSGTMDTEEGANKTPTAPTPTATPTSPSPSDAGRQVLLLF